LELAELAGLAEVTVLPETHLAFSWEQQASRQMLDPEAFTQQLQAHPQPLAPSTPLAPISCSTQMPEVQDSVVISVGHPIGAVAAAVALAVPVQMLDPLEVMAAMDVRLSLPVPPSPMLVVVVDQVVNLALPTAHSLLLEVRAVPVVAGTAVQPIQTVAPKEPTVA
jgi:hypothetical protein